MMGKKTIFSLLAMMLGAVTCSKLAAIDSELCCKITPMYKCFYIEQINVLLTNDAKYNKTGIMTCSKSANTP